METQQASPGKTTRSTAKEKLSKAVAHSQERHRMIAEAAYYHALQRGFAEGFDLDDWFMAEKQISQSS